MTASISNLSSDQTLAIELALDTASRIVGITGEAGTGKTTVLGEVAEQFINRNYTVVLAAPTGRAAARIKEHTGLHGRTIHRLLGWGMPDPDDPDDEGIPRRDRFNPIPADVILIDEASMLSDDLATALYAAMRPKSVIRFFGDANQLPPVEGLSPFLQILERFPSMVLLDNFRSDSGIVKAARQINKGLVPSPNSEFTLLNVGTGLSLDTLTQFLDPTFATPASQVIIPTKVGKYGTVSVNAWLQAKLNPDQRQLLLRYVLENGDDQSTYLRPNDKIIWTKNDYKLNLFNGMIGLCLGFDPDSGDVAVSFDGKDRIIPPHLESYDQHGKAIFRYDPRKYIDLAYAITTHKSQGSEFDRVIILANRTPALVRRNFYTAVTRARKHVTVIAGLGGLSAAMRNDNGLENKIVRRR